MALKVGVKIKRPKFYDHFEALRSDEVVTTRSCSVDGCENEARFVRGWWPNADGKRVRVWGCIDHQAKGIPPELPRPAWVQDLINSEDEFMAKQRKRILAQPQEVRVSIKPLAPSGHGEPLPFDRVANWRWGQ